MPTVKGIASKVENEAFTIISTDKKDKGPGPPGEHPHVGAAGSLWVEFGALRPENMLSSAKNWFCGWFGLGARPVN